ncbi:hypothetical protein [Paraburkholderia gardini]|uniref:hypothetical protein n=1 Tax=Paraburkholderia gardini TaxID=2823469 RepID=UPI001E047FFC|nr:hypothetical protein [Paraburkholderia gardini]CAG4892688.1 hypothetical protein R69919_01437 [Paraburkholderia gardini]
MTDSVEVDVVPNNQPGGSLESACSHVLRAAHARCAAVIVLNGDEGSGYSVKGPLDAQVLLPDILEQMALCLRQQLAKNLN